MNAKAQELALAEERATRAEASHHGAVVNNASAVRAAVETLHRQLLDGGGFASSRHSSRHTPPFSAGRETVLVAVATLMAVELRAAMGLPSEESLPAAEHTREGTTSLVNCNGGDGSSSSSGRNLVNNEDSVVVSASLRAAYRLFATNAQPLPRQLNAAGSATSAAASAADTIAGAASGGSSGNAPVSWIADPAFPFSPLKGDLGDLMASLGVSSPGALARKVRTTGVRTDG